MLNRTIKLILEYDGTNYHGWQEQAGTGLPTIQGILEQALKERTGETTTAYASGRTDAGVHALGQVVHFQTGSSIPSEAWAPALNHVLPADIRVLESDEAPEGFHARFSAKGKIYRYLILNRKAPTALYGRYAWHVNLSLKLAAMRAAARQLTGTNDFSAFRSASCTAASPVRTMKRLDIEQNGEFVEIKLEADSFLMHMARNIAGTLVDVGLGRTPQNEVKGILESRQRGRAGRTAPARGLYLVRVFY